MQGLLVQPLRFPCPEEVSLAEMEKKFENKVVLVVDDDPDFLLQQETQLAAAGFKVLTAESRKQAEEVIEGTKPDLAVIDVMMDEMDGGFVLSYSIKTKYPDVPVIIVSAVSSESGYEFDAATDEEKSWIKADAFLAKPIRIEQLLLEAARILK